MSVERRVLLLSVLPPGADAREESEELSKLTAAAGYFCVATQLVRLREAKAATLLGAGAIETASVLAGKFNAQQIIVGAELSSAQERNLENKWRHPVMDRNGLILTIFGVRARTYESKLQVELAHSRHMLSRVVGQWTHLERQRGGIGLRGGPGEKQIEIDRRLLVRKIKRIEKKIDGMAARNLIARTRRARNGVLTAVLVGYTNAGKSTLFNALTSAGQPANNRLFDTLESTARRIFIGGRQVVAVDTVGFIRNLPHELLSGFRATLQEAAAADLLIVVADASRPDCDEQLAVVHTTLDALGAARDRRLLVMNKIDKIGAQACALRSSCGKMRSVWLSGRSGDGIAELRQVLQEAAAAKNDSFYNSQNNETILSEPTARY